MLGESRRSGRGAARERIGWRASLDAFRFTPRAFGLVRETSPSLLAAMLGLSLTLSVLPAGMALAGKRLVDSVVEASQGGDAQLVLGWMAVEASLVAVSAALARGLEVATSLLRAQLGHKVNVMILEKAQRIGLARFEDADFYDQMTRARREASSRPLSLVRRVFGLLQAAVTLLTLGGLLLAWSPLAVLVLFIGAIPGFVAETRFAGEAFRLFSWRAPEARRQSYLEVVAAREDYAKEVKLLGLGPRLVQEYDQIFHNLYGEDRKLALRRGLWGWGLGLLSTLALYGAYAAIALAAVSQSITLGAMTMYLAVFKQGQTALTGLLSGVGGMVEDNLYLGTLYGFLESPDDQPSGTAESGPNPADGLRFEDVGFEYPGSLRPALSNVSFQLAPGGKLALVGQNGSGKTTLVKLLCRLYEPTTGRILLDGLDLREWDQTALRRRIGVIFQDFQRYQFTAGENIAVGDVAHYEDTERRWRAADKGMARGIIEALPAGMDTQLGRWFASGAELSGGQWQKVALSRTFMREDARVLVLDEPTSAMDAEAESEVFLRVKAMTEDQMAILISHRFSTVRMADQILVLEEGRIVEAGEHEALMQVAGRYATLFKLQARGYA